MEERLDDPAVFRRMARALMRGCEFPVAAAAVGIDADQLDRWRQGHPDRWRLLQLARLRAQARHVRKIDLAGDWRARSWLLERAFPETFHPATRAAVEQTRQDAKTRDALDAETRKRLLDLLEDGEAPARPDSSASPEDHPGQPA